MTAVNLSNGPEHSELFPHHELPLPAMNTKICLFLSALVLSLGLPAWCAAQEAQPNPATSALFAKMRQGEKEDHKLGELAAARDKSFAMLRYELSKPWTSVIIALRKDCSCSGRFRGMCVGDEGTTYSGFRLSRSGESMTVARWSEKAGKEETRESRPMTQPRVEKLLSETTLFYLAAMLTEAPLEKAGPKPEDPAKVEEWSQRYAAAGGRPYATEGDIFWMEVRAATPEGVKRYSDMWGPNCPMSFLDWMTGNETLRPQ